MKAVPNKENCLFCFRNVPTLEHMDEHLAPHSKDEDKREQSTNADDYKYDLQAAFVLVLHNKGF